MTRPALIIGIAGQLGGALARRLGGDVVGTAYRTEAPGALPFDLAEAARHPEVARDLLEHVRPRAVFIAAGFTWVDGCEREPERAELANRDGPAAVAAAARAVGARTIHYSTEYVFDGAAGPYGEADPARPLSVYGRSKLAGEEAVLAEDPRALVIRTTVVYGPEQQGKNFAYQVARELRAGRRMRVPDDQVSTPTYNPDLADASARLVEVGAEGVFHVVGAELLDRATLGRRLAAAVGLDPSAIEPVPTAALGQTAPRPLNAGLTIERVQGALPGWEPRGLEEAVAHWRQHGVGLPWPG